MNADGSRTWHPCEHPERPLDLDVAFHMKRGDEREFLCVGCGIAIEAAQQRSGTVADDVCFGRRANPGDAYEVLKAYRARTA